MTFFIVYAPCVDYNKNMVISADATKFLIAQDVAVLSTLGRDGKVEGAAVYYYFDGTSFFILTKSGSTKAHNMLANHHIALTIYDAKQVKSAQIQGLAHIEADLKQKRYIFDKLVGSRLSGNKTLPPPVTQLGVGGFIIFYITPTRFRYTDYKL